MRSGTHVTSTNSKTQLGGLKQITGCYDIEGDPAFLKGRTGGGGGAGITIKYYMQSIHTHASEIFPSMTVCSSGSPKW